MYLVCRVDSEQTTCACVFALLQAESLFGDGDLLLTHAHGNVCSKAETYACTHTNHPEIMFAVGQ